MKAMICETIGSLDDLVIGELPEPSPGPGEVLVKVGAGNVNFADILLCQGIYQDRPSTPFTPGLETSGTVEAVGEGIDLPLGAHAAGMSALPAGGYGEYALLRGNSVLVFPDHVPFPDVTVLFSTYQTSHVALHHRGHLAAGEWLLVHAGAGGVGSAAIQIGVAAGASVIATAGSPDKIALCRELGAHHTVNYSEEDLYARVKELTDGRGVDVVFDPVGGAVTDISRRLLAWEGRLLIIGFAGGDIPSLPANHVLVKNYSVVGVHWGAYPNHRREVIDIAHADLLRLYDQGKIKPVITETVGLDGIPAALEALEQRRVRGRIVLVPGH